MNVAELIMEKEGKEYMLSQLSHGEEIYWDWIAELSGNGKIERKDALNSLLICLEKRIIEFSDLNERFGAEVLPRGYWQERLDGALAAYDSLKDQDILMVSYRGFSLNKGDSRTILN